MSIPKDQKSGTNDKNLKPSVLETEEVDQLVLWSLDIANDSFSCSKNFLDCFGVSQTDFQYNLKSFLKLLHPDHRELITNIASNKIEKKAFSFDEKVKTATGKIKYLRISGGCVFNDEGEITALTGMCMDVSDDKNQLSQQEQAINSANDVATVNDINEEKDYIKALQTSEGNLQHFIKNTPLSVAMFDKKMNYLTCSSKYLEDWWVKPEETTIEKIVGKNHYQLFDDVRDDWRLIHEKCLKEHIVFKEEEDFFIKANGKKEWLRWQISPWRKVDGSTGGLIIFTEFITRRKEAEELIKQSQSKLSLLLENLPGMVFSCSNDPDWTLTFASNGVTELTGYTPQEFLRKNTPISFDKITHLQDLSRIRQAILKALEEKRIYEVHYRITTKSGQIKHVFERGQGVFDKKNNFLSLEGIILDVSKQKEMEDDLRKSEANLAEAQRISKSGSWEWYIDSNEIRWSDEFYRICGYEPGEVEATYEQYISLLHPEDRKKAEETFDKVLATGQSHHLEARLIRTDKSIRHIRHYGELIIDENTQARKMIGSVQDITEQKEAEQRFNQIFHISPIPISLSTLKDGMVLEVNERFLRLVNMKREEVVGKTSNELGFWNNSQQRIAFVEELKKEGRAFGFEGQLKTSDNAIKDVILTAEVLDIDEQECVLMMIFDISDRKKTENKLLELTKELTSSNEELKQFAYITSHNLRAPVVNIDALLKFINKENLNDPGNPEILNKIEQSVDQLKSSLNDLIQLVSLKDKRDEPNEEIHFSELLKIVTRSLETQISASGTIINLNFEQESIMFKKPVLESILQNLISNAIKYRSEEKPVISIRTYLINGYVCMAIKDNGLGIDLPKYRDKLFGMYERFHENIEGKGLGLYIIKSQVESMGGKIEVDSEPGKGSEFRVYFKV